MKKQPIQGKPIPCFKRWLRTNYAVFASLHRQVTIGVLAIGMSILVLAAEEAAAQTDTVFVFGNTRIDEVEVVGTKQSPSRSILPQTSVFPPVIFKKSADFVKTRSVLLQLPARI